MKPETKRISLSQITANPGQPRKTFDPEAIRELAESIRENGLLQPITVRPMKAGGYEIVAGERRFRASKLLAESGEKRWQAIDANVRKMTDEERDIFATIENLQRVDLTPLEEADDFKKLADRGMTTADIAKRLGLAEFRVKWRLSLLNLSAEIKPLVASGQLSRQDALEVARAPEHQQGKIVRLISSGALVGWKATRNAVDAIVEGKTQADIFGEAGPVASDADVQTLRAMERKIEGVEIMVGKGWRDGECVVASKVDPGRASRMADKMAAIQSALRIMERALRNSAAEVAAVSELPMAAE